MSANSKIEWTDHTFNPWIGCTKVSPGCLHCYAESRDKRHLIEPVDHWGKGAPRMRTSAANWRQPLRWNREAEETSNAERRTSNVELRRRPRVFCASLADWLDDEVPIEWLADLLALIQATPNLDWLLLTKRPENFRKRISDASRFLDQRADIHVASWLNWWTDTGGMEIAPENVWIGTSVEDQARADERIPELIAIPAVVRFLSCEPLLGPLDIADYLEDQLDGGYVLGSAPIHWVICGGESGPNARPMHPDWARSLRDQCRDAGVPFLFKQWGEWLPVDNDPGDKISTKFYRSNRIAKGFEDQVRLDECYGRRCTIEHHVLHNDGSQHRVIDAGAFIGGVGAMQMFRVGKHVAGRELDGREWNDFPETSNGPSRTGIEGRTPNVELEKA